MAKSGETVRSLTDPDSRPMMSGGHIEICYNVQTVVDAKHKLIAAEDVTNDASDRDQLAPMASGAQEVLDAHEPVVVADRGYYHGTQIRSCLERASRRSYPGRSPQLMPAADSSPKTTSSTTLRRMSIGARQGKHSPTAAPRSSWDARSRTIARAPVGAARSSLAARVTETAGRSPAGWTSTSWRRWSGDSHGTERSSRSAKPSPSTPSAR